MLIKWKLNNFKSVRTGSFEMNAPSHEHEAPPDCDGLSLESLTVLAGPNSSGKSSIIQSILLAVQTLRSRDTTGVLQIQDSLIRLGGFKQILSVGSLQEAPEDRVIELGWSLAVEGAGATTLSNISCDFAFDDADVGDHHPNLYPPLRLARIACSTQGDDEPYEVRIKRKANMKGRSYDAAILPKFASAELLKPYEKGIIDDCSLSSILPESVIFSFDPIEEEAEFVLSVLKHSFRYPVQITERLASRYDDPLFDIVIPKTILTPELLGPHAPLKALAPVVTAWEWLRNVWLLYGKPSDSDEVPKSRAEHWKSLREIVNANEHIIRQLVREYALSQTDPQGPTSGSPKNLSWIGEKDKDGKETSQKDGRPLPERLANAVDFLKSGFAKQVGYLGPLREPPKQIYPLSGGMDSKDVGLAGEYTPYVLLRHGTDEVDYLPPKVLNGFTSKVQALECAEKVPLNTAVDEWLQYIGAALGVRVRSLENLGIELKVIMDQPSNDLVEASRDEPEELDFVKGTIVVQDAAVPSREEEPKMLDQSAQAKEASFGELEGFYLNQVGVGVSQVLPILVMCLLQPKGAILLLEQPELHLHPKIQSRLADFFLIIGMLGKQCIVETHGEHWINRLRLHIARSQGGELARMTKVYFVNKLAGVSRFRLVEINRYGKIENWPSDFFDQHIEDVAGILEAGWGKMKDEQTHSSS